MVKKLKYLSNKKGFLGIDNKNSIKENVIVVPFGLEKTVSYGGGTSKGPKEIIKASHQVELYDEELNWVADFNEEDTLSPAFGFEGLGWQLQDGEDGLKFFPFQAIKDSVIEGDETAKFKLSVPRGYIDLGGAHIPIGLALGRTEAKLIIMDDDFTPGELRFSSSDFYVNEADRTATLNVERINGSNGSISVQFKTRDGTASNPFDFRSKQGSLRFASGQTSRSITFNIIDDETQEADEYFDVDIFNVTGGGKLFEVADV